MCAHSGQLGVALTLGTAIPSQTAIQRWFGEPVRAIVVPTSSFQTNKRGFPALPKAHQAVLVSFFQLNVQVGMNCSAVTWCCRLLGMAVASSNSPPPCFACSSRWAYPLTCLPRVGSIPLLLLFHNEQQQQREVVHGMALHSMHSCYVAGVNLKEV